MNKEFRAHPLMILSFMRPIWLVSVVPLVAGAVQYIISRRITGILTAEILLFSIILLSAILRYCSFRLVCKDESLFIKFGVLIKTQSVIPFSKLSSVQTEQNPLDAVFRAVTYRVNTEAGKIGKNDFSFKLSIKNSKSISGKLYGRSDYIPVKFSAVKVAIMAATSSSAVTGMIVGVPVINKAGKLLGIALNDMLFEEINNASKRFQSYLPPIVNTVTIILLLSYAVGFVYSFFKNIRFALYLEKDMLEVRSGFFVRRRTAFRKASVNDVITEQTPLMHIFKRYAMKVSVGGYGSTRREAAVLVPSGRRGEIKRQFCAYFPFLKPDGDLLHAARDRKTVKRFLFFPRICFIASLAVSSIALILFEQFTRFVMFLELVCLLVIAFYAYLCVFESRFGKLRLGKNIYAQGRKGFNTYELYCPIEKIGEIKIRQNPIDRKKKTCSVVLTVRSKSADSVTVRLLDYESLKNKISDNIKIEV